MIEQHYKVVVESDIDVIYEYCDDPEFERDFIQATDKSYDAQTDGYNGEVFAMFDNKEDAEECEVLLTKVMRKYEGKKQ